MSDSSQSDTSYPQSEQSNGEEMESRMMMPLCVKLSLDDHIKAFIKREALNREFEPLNCSTELVDKVIFNYIIVKEILSNMCWQEKSLAKQVCSTWCCAVQALRKEQLGPVDFMIDLQSHSLIWALLQRSSDFVNEPMVVMTFVNSSGLDMTGQCKLIKPSPCAKPCISNHSLLDTICKYTCAPKHCINIVRSDYLSYMPLPNSVTYQYSISNLKLNPYMVGLFIPVIPDVKCHLINITSLSTIKEQFYEVVQRISQDRIFKGIFVYVTDKYLLHTVEDIIFLNLFSDLQPDIPYAIGGCIIEDTLELRDMEGVIDKVNAYQDFFSENLVSISVFTVPKNPQSNECNFNMYSLVLDASTWTKDKIQECINEFAKRVPQFEHSVVVKLSCVGRDNKHKWEQDCFRAAFPNTRLVGCYGNGELGVNHPPAPAPSAHPMKKVCKGPGPQFGIVYSYSTVFVYMGWGKILRQ